MKWLSVKKYKPPMSYQPLLLRYQVLGHTSLNPIYDYTVGYWNDRLGVWEDETGENLINPITHFSRIDPIKMDENSLNEQAPKEKTL